MKDRVQQTGEVFTPEWLVNEMLDKLPPEVWSQEKTFCDPACGNGNMLIPILHRKITVYNHKPSQALKTIRGMDIMRDNIRKTRLRLIQVASLTHTITNDDIAIILQNIVWLHKGNHPKGSLHYNFSFNTTPKPDIVDRWINNWRNNINEDNIVNQINLPVDAEPGTGKFFDLFEEKAAHEDGYNI